MKRWYPKVADSYLVKAEYSTMFTHLVDTSDLDVDGYWNRI